MSDGLRCGWVDAEREGDCSFCGSKREMKVLRVSGKKEPDVNAGGAQGQLPLLQKFYQTWIRSESTHGCYSCCPQHDCRCPASFATPGKCECGRDELEALSEQIDASHAPSVGDGRKSDSASYSSKPTEVRFCYSCLKEVIAKQRWGAGQKVL